MELQHTKCKFVESISMQSSFIPFFPRVLILFHSFSQSIVSARMAMVKQSQQLYHESTRGPGRRGINIATSLACGEAEKYPLAIFIYYIFFI